VLETAGALAAHMQQGVANLVVGLDEEIVGDPEVVIENGQKFALQCVQFTDGHSSHRRPLCIVVNMIIEKLGSHHQTREQQAMDGERINGEVETRAMNAIDVHHSQKETLFTAIDVVHQPLEVGGDGHGRHGHGMKGRDETLVSWQLVILPGWRTEDLIQRAANQRRQFTAITALDHHFVIDR